MGRCGRFSEVTKDPKFLLLLFPFFFLLLFLKFLKRIDSLSQLRAEPIDWHSKPLGGVLWSSTELSFLPKPPF